MKDKFKEKVQSMTAAEIIMAMVEGLRHPKVKVHMGTFGSCEVERGKKVCYGCAATNTVCQIAGIKFTPTSIGPWDGQAKRLKTDEEFLGYFEQAIDALRRGRAWRYNSYAEEGGFAQIVEEGRTLPFLGSTYTQEDLEPYVQLAEEQ